MTIAQQFEQKGIDKGRQEGREEVRLDIARNMLKDGMDRDFVMKMTGLAEEDLKQIRD